MPQPEREPITERERLAVVEHRVSKTEEAITNIEKWTEKLTSLCTQLVKLETEHTHNRQRVDGLERKLDTEIARRVGQRDDLEQKITKSTAMGNVNASWVGWFKVILVSGASAAIGAYLTVFFGGQ